MRAVMLLHGFATDNEDFKPLIPVVEKIYDYVWNENLPGHSKKESFKNFTVDSTFNFILNEYDKISKDYDRIDCIGFSMGGALASYLQSVRKINRLVLLAPANKYFNLKVVLNRAYVKYLDLLNKRKIDSTYEMTLLDQRLQSIKADDKNSFKMAVHTLLPNYTIQNMITFSRIVKRCNKDLNEITPPTLIVWGNLDQLVPEESVRYDYSICSNKEKKFFLVPDLSHLMLRSNEIDCILKEVEEFIKCE